MRADQKVIHDESREVIKKSLQNYPHDPSHVAMYCASMQMSWNEFQAQISREGYTGSGRVQVILDAVEDHLKAHLNRYLLD